MIILRKGPIEANHGIRYSSIREFMRKSFQQSPDCSMAYCSPSLLVGPLGFMRWVSILETTCPMLQRLGIRFYRTPVVILQFRFRDIDMFGNTLHLMNRSHLHLISLPSRRKLRNGRGQTIQQSRNK